jgi:hypothetical protein
MPDPSQEQFREEQAHGREVMAQQQAEIDQERAATAQKAEQKRLAEEEQENEEPEQDRASRLVAARNADRGGGGGAENGPLLEDNPQLKKQADKISNEIKEEKKKIGEDYVLIYLFLTVLGATFDLLSVIFDLTAVLAWLNLIIGPTYSVIRFFGVRYANSGIKSKELEQMNLINTLISGALSTCGVPSRAASMIVEFSSRREIAREATKKMAELQKKRDKLLGPVLAKQYMPPK